MSFANLGLAEPLVRALEAKGYTTPTPIQAQSIPILLEGGDLLGIAQTGTGKTAAFVLPSIQRLTENQKRVLPTHCRMLVLAPTRELASQIADSARAPPGFARTAPSPRSARPVRQRRRLRSDAGPVAPATWCR